MLGQMAIEVVIPWSSIADLALQPLVFNQKLYLLVLLLQVGGAKSVLLRHPG